MRPWILAMATACSMRQPAVTPPVTGGGCDPERWRALANTPWRARLASEDLLVTGSGGDRIEVLARSSITELVRGIVPVGSLTRVVTREAPLRSAPDALPMGVFAEPGCPVTGSGAWLSVEDRELTATGLVPADATGVVWHEPHPCGKWTWREDGAQVLAEPRTDAPQIAEINREALVIEQLDERPDGWRRVEACDDRVRVAGWVAPPLAPAAPRDPPTFDDDMGFDLLEPEGAGIRCEIACIRHAPDEDAEVIGIHRCWNGHLDGGWVRVALATPWGDLVGYLPHVRPDAPWL
jgi:hypothetical protein